MKIKIFNNTKEKTEEFEIVLNDVFKKVKNRKTCSIIFVDNDEIKRMNQTYRDIDEKTDVLSFPNDNKIDTTLGDIFISLDEAKRQAKLYEHSINREIAFLAVHGYLHLLGYNHETKEEEKLMIAKQEEILKKAKLER